MAFTGNFNRRPEFKPPHFQRNTSKSQINPENLPRSYQAGVTQRRHTGFMNGAVQCTYCHKRGHNKENCWELKGFPPGHPKFKGKRAAHVALIDDATDDGVTISNNQYQQYMQWLNE